VVIASATHVRLYRYDRLPGDGQSARPVAQVVTAAPVEQIATRPGDARIAVIAALADRSVVEIELREEAVSGERKCTTHMRLLSKDVGGVVQALVCTRRRLLLVLKESGVTTPTLLSIDATSGRDPRRARLGLASLTSVAALDPDRHDLLVALDSRRGAHVVGFAPNTDGDILQLSPLDSALRATAMTALGEHWMAVARKGGDLVQVRTTTATGVRADTPEEFCRRLRLLLKRCGCPCHRQPPGSSKPCRCCDEAECPPGGGPGRPGGEPGDPGGGRPGGGARPGSGRPGGALPDDEPCEERKRGSLTWSPASLLRAGRHLVAVAAGGKRLAVLDRDLNVMFERSLGARGALVVTGGRSDRLLTLRRGSGRLEILALDDYVRGLRAVDVPAPGRRNSDPRLAKPVVYRGRPSRPASPNPHLRVCVFTVTEPGQAFGDPDQAKMQALLQPNVYLFSECVSTGKSCNPDKLIENLADTAGKLWTLPNTALGVGVGLPGVPFGARITFGNNAIQFENYPWGTGALTLGNAIIYGGGTSPSDVGQLYGDPRVLNVGLHEMGHTYQYQALGPLFLPIYFFTGGISSRNPFERAANDFAGGGSWWPR
jgi:hypothetical protein